MKCRVLARLAVVAALPWACGPGPGVNVDPSGTKVQTGPGGVGVDAPGTDVQAK
jgi:hypothetical protein